MTYAHYVFAAYAVFVLVLGWEFFSTRIRIVQLLRKARLRSDRGANRPAAHATEGGSP